MKPNWELEIDTPATVAVIGGGAIGIEAALYARFLGYYVLIIDAARMCQSWSRSAHLPMLIPFGQAASPLGLAALDAHQPEVAMPGADSVLTGQEFVDRYLIPLARTDLLVDSVHVHSRVMSVSRIEARREAAGDIQDRADVEFRLAIHSKKRGWFAERADIVLDCSGVSEPRWLGPGGGMAIGEVEQSHLIERGLLNMAKCQADYANQRIVLTGMSLDALQNLRTLLQLSEQASETKITWLVPMDLNMNDASQWLAHIQTWQDGGPELASDQAILAALKGQHPRVGMLPCVGIERMIAGPQGLNLTIQLDENNTVDSMCDRVVANVGLEANWDHARALRIGRSSVLDRPTLDQPQLAQSVTTDADGDSHSAVLQSVDLETSILTMEPHYYVLGSKSFGLAHDRFTLSQGHQQIRQAFAWIGGRETLDLYSNIRR